MKFKAEEFLRDIGLDMHIQELERTIETTNNIYQLPVANLSADFAIMRIIDNLDATYGEEMVTKVLKQIIEIKEGGN